MSQHLYAQSFSENPLADPIIHGSLSGDSAAAAWQSAAYDLLLEPGTSWRSPAFDVEPLSYVRLSFRARLKADEILAAPTASRYNRNHLSIKSINPDATWNLDPLYAGPSGGDLIADDNTSLVNLSDQWTEQVFYSRVQANARQASVSLAAIDAAYFIDDIKIESVADQLDVSAWIDGIWSQRFYSSALVQAPEINTPISSEQQFRLARTLAKLQAGQSVRIVLCGDSIVNDLSNSGFDVLLERAFPGASVSMITAVGGGTGMDQWNPSNSTYPFISSSSYRGALNFNQAIAEQEPDLVILGGISTPANQSGYAAFQDIISKLRSGALISRLGYQPDILIATGAFGSVATSWNPSLQLTATQGNYRGSLLQIANTNNVGFWDLTQAWGEYLLASLNSTDPQAIHSPLSRQHYWRDNVHANTFGKQILGRALTDYLATAEPASLDSPVVSLSVSPDLVTEDGAAGLSFTFSRTGSTAESLDVFFTVDGTAVSGSDYSGLEGTGGRFSIVIPSGSASATLTIKPIVDNLAESDESVVLVLDSLAGRGYTIATDTPVTGIIKNVDAQVGLSVSPAMVEEDGGETLIFIFRRVGDLSKALAVHYAMSGSASADSDYIGVDSSSATHTVLFDPGSDTASLVIKPIADTVFESNETVVLTVLSGSGYSFGSSASATGVIKNDDPKAVAISSITDNVGSIQGPIAEGAFSNDTTPTLSGSLSAALAAGESLSIFRNGSLAGSARVSGTSWSFTPTTAIAGSGLQSFSAAVVDGAGNTGPLSPARSFLLDSSAPTQTVSISAVIDDTDPQQGSVAAGGRTNDSTPTLSGLLSAPLAAGESLWLYNGSTFLTEAVVTPGALSWSATPNLSLNGSYALNARVVDAAGNLGRASANRALILDTIAPQQSATISSISDNVGSIQGPIAEGAFSNDTTPTLSGSLSAALAAGESLSIFRNGSLAGSARVSGTSWSFTPTTAIAGSGLQSFSAAVVDGAGNTGPLSPARSFLLDSSAPTQTVSISAVIDNTDPQQGSVAAGGSTNDSTPTLSGTLSAPLAAGESVWIYNGFSFLSEAVVAPGSLSWSATVNLTQNGSYALNARVVDAAGNLGRASANRALILDTIAPQQSATISSISDNVGSIQGPIAEGAFSNDTTPTLSGSLSAALGSGERLSIYRNGSLAGYASVSGASWSFTPSTAITASGLQSFSAAVVDGAGNTGPLSPARSFLLDSNAETTWTYDWGSASPLGTTPGILLARVSLQSPRSGEPNLKVTALRVDLTTPGLRLTATGPSADWQANTRETVTSTTRGFVSTSRQEGTPVVAAINTAFFTLTNGSQAVPANLKGLAVRDGVVVSPAENGFSALLIDPITGARIEQISSTSVADPTSLQLAVSGGQFAEGIVLSNGIPSGDTITQNARSALGLSQDRRYLTMLTVDRELRDFTPSYYGATRRDVGTILAGMGSHTGMNLDGGGSTQMAWWNPTSGASELLNAPLGGVERFVGSNLGVVYQQPLVEALG